MGLSWGAWTLEVNMSAPPFPSGAIRVYDAGPVRVVDGDTIDVIEWRPIRLRLLGVDTPERSDRAKWEEATKFTEAWIVSAQERGNVRVQTAAKDAFGRELAWVWDTMGSSLNDDLILGGVAEPYRPSDMIQAALDGREV
jgi:endonuclease YncB( thermonuclease family)